MINYRTIANILGSLLLIEAFLFVICQCVAFVYHEADWYTFGLPFALTVASGVALKTIGRRRGAGGLNRRDTYLILASTWIVFTLFGMLPLILSGSVGSITDAFFETMSGFTTTGATVLTHIHDLPHAILFWRSLMHWLGGLGIVFFTLAILPSVGMSDVRLFSVETTGFKLEKLHPRFSVTAHWLLSIYLLLTLGCGLSLWLCGMPVFDSINHALSTVASGGFSVRDASIMDYHSASIEYVLCGFMFFAGINFSLIYLFVIKRDIATVFHDWELRTYIIFILTATVVITLVLTLHTHYDIGYAFRASLFQVVSLQTSTGFLSDDFMAWPRITWIVLLVCMFVGGCAGSTAGGYKCIRILTACKFAKNELLRQLHPRAILPVRFGKYDVSKYIATTFIAFTVFYFFLFLLGTVLFIIMGLPLLDSFSLSVSSLSNSGPSIGHLIGATDSWTALHDGGKWLSAFLMLAGRLELFSVLMPFYPHFWTKN